MVGRDAQAGRAREAWKRGLRGLATYFGEGLGTARGWLETRYQSELVRALFAPWVLHTGLGPESTYSGQMGKVIAFALEVAAHPLCGGGAKHALTAFERLIRDHGGDIELSADVERVLLDGDGAARGVRLAGGKEIEASKGVICSVTPGISSTADCSRTRRCRPISRTWLPPIATARETFRSTTRAKAPPQWKAPALAGVALTHLTPGLDGVSKAANEAELAACCRWCRRSVSANPRRSISAAAPRASRSCGCSFLSATLHQGRRCRRDCRVGRRQVDRSGPGEICRPY